MRLQQTRVALAAASGLAAIQFTGGCAGDQGTDGATAAGAPAFAAPTATPAGGVPLAPARGGPLSGADRDLLVKVRQAGLWETRVGDEARTRASRAKTREHLGEIARQHRKLDADVRSVATRLRVPLPDEATEEQRGWIAEISGKSGLDYDRTAVKRLRLAHGKVFPVIAQVRATSRNTLIRDFAERAARFVNDHMDMLEATGLAGPSAIPPPPPVLTAPDVVPSGEPAPVAPPVEELNARLGNGHPAADRIRVDGPAATGYGPLSGADLDLLVKVRQAGLWEIPVGRQAERRASRSRTRRNLGEISRQHVRLDADVRSVAARLRVPLPDEATEEQRGWIAEISGKSGLDYDRTAVKRLRLAHGKVFPVIAQVRATTRNTLVRAFADRAQRFVGTHMALLEGTGLVGPMALPSAPPVTSAPRPAPPGGPAPSAPPATSLPLSGLPLSGDSDEYAMNGHGM
ncbi:hypothetical protein Sru01_49880 [Sphaerisporangium rufum]|uniref:DUF4142 domain-containing protein n=1 Tax=Sphaerisporangium rufum TaxID=1381558 RepID=A0A919V0E9_9ACTN|nr:DUF4142 domain-containing protein [Sphaerisporangium rufum]GII80006.1 hypothetical protein Sru01_49880 [Sphaerisporangium rufum]